MSTGQKKSTGPCIAQAVADSEALVSDYPLSSVLVVFGMGLGVGLVLVNVLGGAVTPRPSFGRRTELAAEKLGRQVLDAIVGSLPESIAKHISS